MKDTYMDIMDEMTDGKSDNEKNILMKQQRVLYWEQFGIIPTTDELSMFNRNEVML